MCGEHDGGKARRAKLKNERGGINPPLRLPTFLPCKFSPLLIALFLIAYWVIASRGEFVLVAGDFENSVAADLVP